ncbi:hypothetical protein AK830_g7547 [Neonectria ditissima]|uniref:BTB domain-containing protein n=1 Tax=Neonectria ditissima TaxID=78410 RepID=A0A0P7AMJ6_9HYPO|nr:hypothetical protein AK830_g7547 [Neonectria ditissima]
MSSHVVNLDKHSDIELRVGTDDDGRAPAMTFQCCSRTLARSSPVFSRMLYGDSADPLEQKDSAGEWHVDLPDDDAVSFSIFLTIIHGHFDRVPRAVTIKSLHGLITLTNYHNATDILSPWAGSWISSLNHPANIDRASQWKTLWICWELRCAVGFSETAHYILMHSEKCELADIPVESGMEMPPDIVERIRAIRIQTIRELLSAVDDAVKSLIVVEEKPSWFRHARWVESRRCESIVLGSLMFCLMGAGLWPLPDAHNIQDSIADLRTKIAGLVFYDIGPDKGEVDVDYGACNPGPEMLDKIGQIMSDIADPVSSVHRQHLNKQT